MSNIKKILVTTMSISSRKEENNYFFRENGIDICCSGLITMEPGSKYILHNHPINEIIAIGTKDTITDDDVLEVSNLEEELKRLEGTEKKLSAFELYKYNIIKYLLEPHEMSDKLKKFLEDHKGSASLMEAHPENIINAKNKKLPINFVREQVEGSDIDNISEIVNTIYKSDADKIELYIDVQGGNRTSIYVRNAALSILNNQFQNKIDIKETIATNYKSGNEKNEIVDETQRYRILDLVSGMNAFIQYGKADMIKKYCSDMKIEKGSDVDNLVGYMADIDDAISLCDMTALAEAVENMANLTDSTAKTQGDSIHPVENIFNILIDGIKKDYGSLVAHTKVDYVELISWCARKDFIQQALTLIEDKMPDVYFKKKVFLYKFIPEEKEQKFISALGLSYETKENKIFYHLKYALDGADLTNDYRNINIEDVKKAKKHLLDNLTDPDFSEEQFVDEYCSFRKLEHLYEARFVKPIDDQTILVCCEKQQGKSFTVQPKNKNKSEIKARIAFWTNENLDEGSLKLLEHHLFLHEALKKERNCCNHASEKGIRLPIVVVKRAIEIYIKNVRKILSVVSNSQV